MAGSIIAPVVDHRPLPLLTHASTKAGVRGHVAPGGTGSINDLFAKNNSLPPILQLHKNIRIKGIKGIKGT
jgi:hypothetical protein